MQHKIDLSATPHKAGQSQDLETKRRRLWERLPEDERVAAIEAYEVPALIEMPLLQSGGAYERVLYVLVSTGKRLTPEQLSYVILARWYHNTDAATIRAKLAMMVERGHARWTKHGRYYSTDEGIAHMRAIEYGWRSTQPRHTTPGADARANAVTPRPAAAVRPTIASRVTGGPSRGPSSQR